MADNVSGRSKPPKIESIEKYGLDVSAFKKQKA